MTIDPIGIAGSGEMAAAIAARIANRSGCRVIVHGFAAELAGGGRKPRIERAANLFDLASECEAVIAVYETHSQLREALTGSADRPGLLGAMAPGNLLIDFSGGLPVEVSRLAGQLSGGAIGLVECGIVGGHEAIAVGRAQIYAGGFGEHVERVTPVLAGLGMVRRIGPQGSGRMFAALSEAIAAAQVLALHEAQAVAQAGGYVPDELAAPPLPEAEFARMVAQVAAAQAMARAHSVPSPLIDALAGALSQIAKDFKRL